MGLTPVAVADGANFTDAGYMAIQGGSATQRIDIYEVEIAGLAAAAAATPLLLCRDSVVGATITGLASPNSNGALDPATAALAAPQQCFVATTTKPNRSTSAARLALGLNAFGGIIRWNASPGSEFKILGNTASNGEASLSAFTGGAPALVEAHILYETF
jgi:hypothetical protein